MCLCREGVYRLLWTRCPRLSLIGSRYRMGRGVGVIRRSSLCRDSLSFFFREKNAVYAVTLSVQAVPRFSLSLSPLLFDVFHFVLVLVLGLSLVFVNRQSSFGLRLRLRSPPLFSVLSVPDSDSDSVLSLSSSLNSRVPSPRLQHPRFLTLTHLFSSRCSRSRTSTSMSTLMSTSHVSRPASPFHTYHHHHHYHHPPRHCPLSSINAMLYSTYCTPHTFHIYVPRNIPLPPSPVLLTFIPSVPLPPHFPSFCVLYSGGVVWCNLALSPFLR